MPFLLSDDERLIQETVRSFAQAITLDAAAGFDRHDQVPAQPLADAAGLGLLAMALPQESGGAGPTALALALDEVAQVCPNTAAILGVHNQAVAILHAAGVPGERIQQLSAQGPITVLLTEEATGSNALEPGTGARPDGDGVRLNGQKVWGLGAAAAAHHIVLAQAPGGPTLYLVPAATPGVDLGRPEAIMGLRGSGIRTVYLSEAPVPASARLGTEGQGAELAKAGRAVLQVAVAAAMGGAVAGALAAAKDFAQSRIQFGQPIASYQAVSDALATTDIQLHAARSLTLAAAGRLGSPDAALWAARAKAFATDTAIAATRAAIRIQGGTGFMREGGTERFARDVRALQFVGEPMAVQRDIVRRSILDIELGPSP